MTLAAHGRFDTPPDMAVAVVAARQHGRVRIEQLLACGLGEDAVARRVAKGQLHRIHAGVYAVGHRAETLDALWTGAVLAGGEGAALSHWAAASCFEFVRWDGRRVEVTVRGTGGRARAGIRFHRSRTLLARDITRRHGIALTSAARTLLDIAPLLSDRRLKRVVRQAQAEGLTDVRQLADVLRRANGRRATKRLAALVADGPTPTRSGHEDVVLDLVLGAGVQRPAVNQRLVVDGVTYYPDLRWPRQRLILEIDSAWHDGRLAQELDAERQADLEAAGERVLRTTLAQAVQHPRQLVRRLVAAGAPCGGPQT